MSRETNEGVMMHSKKIMMNFLKIVHPLVEPITSLAKPKASLEAYFFIRQLPLTVTFTKHVVSPSLFSFFFFGHMLISNRYSSGNVESHVGNSADSCRGRNTTIKLKYTARKEGDLLNDNFIINLNNLITNIDNFLFAKNVHRRGNYI